MPSSSSPFGLHRFAAVLLLPGCLVSFNDYPLGDIHEPAANGGSSNGSAGQSEGAAGNSAGKDGSGATGNVSAGANDAGGSVATAGSDAGGNSGSNTAGSSGSENGGSESAGSGSGGSAGSETGGSDAGGTSGAGGDAGGGLGGMGGMGGTAPLVDPNLVDDFEDGNESIIAHEGRSGAWYTSNDGRGSQTPKAGALPLPSLLDPERDSSKHAVHTYGSTYPYSGQGWALLGTKLAPGGYDLSKFKGVKLWVRSGSGSSSAAKEVRFNFPTPITVSGCSTCNDHLGVVVPLTTKWTQVSVAFANVKQQGYGRPRIATPDLTQASALEFLFPTNTTYDLWVDDIELY